MVVLERGKGDVGRLIVGGNGLTKSYLFFTGLLLSLLVSQIGSFISIPSQLKRDEMLGNDTVGESGNASINALEDVGISEVMSFFVTVDVSAVDMDVVDGTIVDFKLEKSNIGEAKSDAIEVSSISLSFSIALVSSESSLGACISYGFSSPLISPKIIHNNIICCQHISPFNILFES